MAVLMTGAYSSETGDSENAHAVRRIVEEVRTRRLRGEPLDDAGVLAAHPQLAAELGRELRKMALVEGARRRAADSAASDAAPAVQAPAADWVDSLTAAGYQIVREIQRGGQGIVYQAVQESTHRSVAIKMLAEGPLSRARDWTRFDREVQVLAALSHPNIVAIHDSGRTTGCAYYVMDYVSGEPLDQHFSGREGAIDEILPVFRKVCDAVGAAHLLGVVHRDLKPANILVDVRGEPRILDFGLAKIDPTAWAADSSATAITLSGEFIGSIPWASPEQASGREVDARTDVYALGVVLYQLLTGGFPYDVGGGVHQALDSILHAAPRRTRIANPDLDDELETVVLKCLAKEPERRYGSALELGRDLDRYQSGEPIDAKRDSRWYVLSKTLRKHRVVASMSLALLLLLIGSTVTVSWLYSRAAHHAQLSEERRRGAEAQTARALTVQAFLQRMLEQIDPEEARGRDVTLLLEMLDDVSQRIERELAGQPAAEAAIRRTIGNTYLAIDRFDEAEAHLLAAVARSAEVYGRSSLERAVSLQDLALAYSYRGAYDKARLLLEESLATPDAPDPEYQGMRARGWHYLANLEMRAGRLDDAEDRARRAVDADRALGAERAESLCASLRLLAEILMAAGRYDDAEAAVRDALSVRPHAQTAPDIVFATMLDTLGELQRRRGDLEGAKETLEQSLAIARQALKAGHHRLAKPLNELVIVATQRGDEESAERYLREALEVTRNSLGEQHPEAVAISANLAGALMEQGRLEEAEPLIRSVFDATHERFGPEHPETAAAAHNLAGVLFRRGRLSEAETLLRDAMTALRASYGDEHPAIAKATRNLAACIESRGDLAVASELYDQALRIQRAALGVDHPEVAGTLAMLGRALIELNRAAEAEPLLRECAEICAAKLGDRHDSTDRARATLGICLARMGRYDEAEGLLVEADRRITSIRGAPDKLLVWVATELAAIQDARGQTEQAAEWRRRATALEADIQTPR
jgi:serine/threonine protein kinase/Tfp pilus assembly protein PilF